MSLWIHDAKFKVIDCRNPRNCVLETEKGTRSSLDVVGLFLSGHVKLTNANNDDTSSIATLSTSVEELKRVNAIAKDFDNLPKGHGKLRAKMEKLATKYGISISTLARWKRNYLAKGVSGLCHKYHQKGGRGKKRLSPEVEAMIKSGIETHFLCRTPKSMDETIRLIRSQFAAQDLVPPSVWVIRNRIKSLSENSVLRAQKGSSYTKDQLHVSQGEHIAIRPLQEVQIDHSPLDIQILSTDGRQVVGRPQVTLVQDIHTRVILGLYIGLEHPSFLSVSKALRESIFPKDDVLSTYQIHADKWPAYGLMEMIHSDNAVEFDGSQMDHFCLVNRVEKQFRPIGSKEFGGHIESGIKLIMKYVHTLPGTTFSNSKERGDYNSEGKAQIDLNELRKLIYRRVINIENHRERDELGGLSPIKMWQQAIDDGWSPRMPADYDQFRYSLLPYKERQITRHGISILGLKYSGPCLRHWRAQEKPSKKETYRIYYDPVDMRWADFVHPDGSGTSKVSLISLVSEHPISLEEIKAAKQKSVRYPAATPDLHLAHQQEKEILEEASKKNKKARKSRETRADNKNRNVSNSLSEPEALNSSIDYTRVPDYAKTDNT